MGQMQTLTRRHVVVVEGYDHMEIMDENVKWIKKYKCYQFFLNLMASFCAFTFTS